MKESGNEIDTSNIIVFKDSNFLNQFLSNNWIDRNNDGKISEKEAENFSFRLECNDAGIRIVLPQ